MRLLAAVVVAFALQAGVASAATPTRESIARDVMDWTDATGVVVSECREAGSHVRCAGRLDIVGSSLQRCRFVAREYPHGKRPGDADGFLDIAVGQCAHTTKAAMVRRQVGFVAHRR